MSVTGLLDGLADLGKGLVLRLGLGHLLPRLDLLPQPLQLLDFFLQVTLKLLLLSGIGCGVKLQDTT